MLVLWVTAQFCLPHWVCASHLTLLTSVYFSHLFLATILWVRHNWSHLIDEKIDSKMFIHSLKNIYYLSINCQALCYSWRQNGETTRRHPCLLELTVQEGRHLVIKRAIRSCEKCSGEKSEEVLGGHPTASDQAHLTPKPPMSYITICFIIWWIRRAQAERKDRQGPQSAALWCDQRR